MNEKYSNNKIEVILKNPSFVQCSNDNVIIIDADKPMWLKTSITGRWLFDVINASPLSIEELLQKTMDYYELPEDAIRQPVIEFINQLDNVGFIRLKKGEDKPISTQVKSIHKNDGSNDNNVNEEPLSIWFNIISQCNMSCPYCFLIEDKDSKPISLEKAQYIIDDIATLNPKKLYISGGEPIIHPNLLDIVRNAKKRQNWQIILETNGFTDDVDLIKELSENVDYFHIPFDGVDAETHDKIRGTNSFIKAINFLLFLDSIKSKAKTCITFTPQPCNVHQMPMLYNFAVKLKADMICITKPKIPARNNPDSQFIDQFLSIEFRNQVYNYYDQLIKIFADTATNNSPTNRIKLPTIYSQFDQLSSLLKPIKRESCGAGSNNLFINEKGECYPCVALGKKEYLLGNIFSNPIKEIYENNVLQNFRCKINVNRIPECKECLFKCFCAGDCRALSCDVKDMSPFCELIKRRYGQLFNIITITN